MAELLLDDQGRPLPQVNSEDGLSLIQWQGKNGAGNMNLKEYTPQDTDTGAGTGENALPVVILIPGDGGPVNLQGDAVDGLKVQITKALADIPAIQQLYNGLTYEAANANINIEALASASRTATTESANVVNTNHRGCYILVNATAGTGYITTINVKAVIGSIEKTVFTIATGLSAAMSGVYAYAITPASMVQNGFDVAPIVGVLPRTFKIEFVHNDANSLTYEAHVALVD